MQKSERKNAMMRIVFAAAFMAAAFLLPLSGAYRAAAFLIPYLIVGFKTLKRAARGIGSGSIFDESFLMAVASLGAFFIGEYPEAVAVMLFNAVGELFEDSAVHRSRDAIKKLMDIRPDHANAERGGEIVTVSPQEVKQGEIVVIRPGERVPLDGEIIEGATTLDTSSLTGEAVPRSAQAGENIISGCVNLTGAIRVRVSGSYAQSTVSRILELVEEAAERKAKTENLITRFARYYTPAVCALALLVCILPPIFTGAAFAVWFKRALVFLVISCPCALVLSVPLTFYAGIGCASKNGILVKGSHIIEALNKCDTVVLDKTGTLTEGKFALRSIETESFDKDALLSLAAHAESLSTHPIARAICAAYEGKIDAEKVDAVTETAGCGVTALVDGKQVAVGSARLMKAVCGEFDASGKPAGIYVAVDGKYAGVMVIEDQIKQGAAQAIAELKKLRVTRTVMLTGDKEETAQRVAEQVKVDQVHAQLLPQDKVTHVEALLHPEGTLLFAGDGVNDAPVLARADIGAAMGAMGSDAAVEAADLVLMDDDPRKLPLAIRIARRTVGIAWQNIAFALAVKAIVMLLGTCGLTGMWEAVFADVGVMVLAVMNAVRAMKIK